MRDVQNEKPEIKKYVDKVGIKELVLPYSVYTREGNIQSTVANVSAYVSLDKRFRGINMSRIPRVLHKHIDKAISTEYVELVLWDLKETLGASSSYLEVKFPYFMKRFSPVRKEPGYVFYECCFEGVLKKERIRYYLTVNVPYMSVCECSKEISSQGAHNQRSFACITITYCKENQVWIEELVELVESNASAPIFSVLRREDEKWVTEYSYNNPRFVETMARRIAKALEKDKRVFGFVVAVNHYESIHQHNAVAVIHGGRIHIP